MCSQPVFRLLQRELWWRGVTPGRRPLCLSTASPTAKRRDIPRYRFELENRLLFGNVVRQPGRSAASPEPPPPPDGVTFVSECGFLEGRVGVTARSGPAAPPSAPPSARPEEPPEPPAVEEDAPAAAAPPDLPTAAVPQQTGCLYPEQEEGEAETETRPAVPPQTGYMYPEQEEGEAETETRPAVPPQTGYLYPEQEEGEAEMETEPAVPLASVSRVLQATMSEESREALRRWEQTMVRRHGPDGFAAIKQAMFATGRELHEAIHGHLAGRGPERPLSASAVGFWRSVRPVLTYVDSDALAAAELPLRHRRLGYRGVVDCVAPFRSCPMVIEWKTARRPKSRVQDLYDNPVQAAAYLGAYNFTHRKAQVDRAAVVVAYESGRPATVHVLSPAACRHYWSVWLRRLLLYRQVADVL